MKHWIYVCIIIAVASWCFLGGVETGKTQSDAKEKGDRHLERAYTLSTTWNAQQEATIAAAYYLKALVEK